MRVQGRTGRKAYVGITSASWLEALRSEDLAQEVNFWRPGHRSAFSALSPRELFLFKRRAPDHRVVGGGEFHTFVRLPIRGAWERFGTRNGVESLAEFLHLVAQYRRVPTVDEAEVIGCIVLRNLFLWTPDRAFTLPTPWAPNIVQGRTFNESEQDVGARFWSALLSHDRSLADRFTRASDPAA